MSKIYERAVPRIVEAVRALMGYPQGAGVDRTGEPLFCSFESDDRNALEGPTELARRTGRTVICVEVDRDNLTNMPDTVMLIRTDAATTESKKYMLYLLKEDTAAVLFEMGDNKHFGHLVPNAAGEFGWFVANATGGFDFVTKPPADAHRGRSLNVGARVRRLVKAMRDVPEGEWRLVYEWKLAMWTAATAPAPELAIAA